MSNKLLGIALAALLMVVAGAVIADRQGKRNAKETTPVDVAPPPEPAPVEAPPPRESISRETVESMYYGYKYEDAAAQFGAPSDEIETEYEKGVDGYTAPYVVTWHIWHNADGSSVRLGFVNGKMDRKQFISADGEAALPEPVHADPEKLKALLEE